MGEDLADEQAVTLATEATGERLAELRQLLAQAALGELGQQLGLVRARDKRIEHAPHRDAERLRGDARELDAGVLEHFVQPLHLAAALLDLRLALAGQVAQFPDRLRRDKARAHQPELDKLADPGGVLDVGLASRDVAQVLGVQEPALAALLEQVVDGLPVAAGRLHAGQRHCVAVQPVGECEQSRRRGRKGARLLQPLPRLRRVTRIVAQSSAR